MQFLIWVLVVTTFIGSSLIPFGNITFAQNTAVAPIYIDRAIYSAAQEGFLCSRETIEQLDPSEREAREEICGLNLEIDNELVNASTAETPVQESNEETPILATTPEPISSSVVNNEDEEVSLLPDPEVEFVEDYMLKFGDNENRNTIFYGGVVPFVAIPDTELATDDSFFNDDSFSVFFYLKRKF